MSLAIALPDEILDDLARRVAQLLTEQTRPGPEPWLDVDQAAAHLGYTDRARGRRRIYDLANAAPANRFPVHRDGRRLIFRASELDAWIEETS